MVKVETENFKSIKKRKITHKGSYIRLSTDLSVLFKPEGFDMITFKVLKSKNLQQRMLYLAKLPFRMRER